MDEFMEEIMYGDTYKEVTSENIVGNSRWHTMYEQVFQKIEDGTYWELSWRRGSTEYQDDGPEDVSLVEVIPKEVTVIKYVRKT